MHKLRVLIFCLSLSTALFGQGNSKPNHFTLKGQITETAKKQFLLIYESESGVPVYDTILVKDDGSFFFQTNKIKSPQQARFNSSDLFVAPGYDLTITANSKDQLNFYKSKKISGVGSQSNRYLFMIDSIAAANTETGSWFNLDEAGVVKFAYTQKSLRDSLAHIVFDKKAINDKYLTYFGKVSRLDNTFQALNTLVSYLTFKVNDRTRYAPFLKQNFDNQILNNLYKEEYLLSSQYKSLIRNQFVDYLVMIDYSKDSTLRKRKDYSLEKVSKTYTGKVREYVLYSKINGLIIYSKSFKELNQNKGLVEPYFPSIKNAVYKNALEQETAKIEAQLKATQAGMPAPSFTLESNTGRKYSLEDFRGKVVYLDLWASWCHPCREETPYLKKLSEKFKERNDIAFIGISLDESLDKWKKALQEDNPSGIQLIDKGNVVSTSYVANVIPQFVIIDKKGNIVKFDAPRPSDNIALEKILNEELLK